MSQLDHYIGVSNLVLLLIGLAGLVQAYQACIQSVQLYGPTNISPIINHVAHFAHEAAHSQTATVSCKNRDMLYLIQYINLHCIYQSFVPPYFNFIKYLRV